MTLLEDRPEAEEVPPAPQSSARHLPDETWLDTSDHKRLGLLFVYTALAFLVAAGVVGLVIGAKQTAPGFNLAADRWLRLYSLHTTSSVLLFLTAIWFGLATYVVPLQIGAGRLALPRLHALGFWLYLVGGGCLIASYISGPINGVGLTSSTPIPPIPGGVDKATNLWIVSLALIAFGFLLTAASLVTTVAMLRTEGMTLLRLPLFSWGTLLASAMTLIATPVFLAGVLILYLDQHFGGTLLSAHTPGAQLVWQRTLWLWGRPDVYLLTLFAIAAACDVVATHAGRELVGHQAAVVLLGLFGALSFTSWAAGKSVAGAVVVPTYSVLTTLVVIPLGLLVLLWLGTLYLGRPQAHVSLAFVAGALLLWVLAAANAVAAGVKNVPGQGGTSAWVVGNVHVVVAGAPTLLAVGALYHWGPKLWGRRLSVAMGALAFVCLLGGFGASGMAGYLLGYNGARMGLLPHPTSYQKGLAALGEAGGALVVLGVLVVLADLALSVLGGRGQEAGDDPYQGLTLEWATSSPPPREGFESVPEVRSAAPLLELRAERGTGGRGS
jgi:cytochrome c oxidase subunit 1